MVQLDVVRDLQAQLVALQVEAEKLEKELNETKARLAQAIVRADAAERQLRETRILATSDLMNLANAPRYSPEPDCEA